MHWTIGAVTALSEVAPNAKGIMTSHYALRRTSENLKKGVIDQKIVSFFSLLLKRQKPSLMKLAPAAANPTVLWWIKTNRLQPTNIRKIR